MHQTALILVACPRIHVLMSNEICKPRSQLTNYNNDRGECAITKASVCMYVNTGNANIRKWSGSNEHHSRYYPCFLIDAVAVSTVIEENRFPDPDRFTDSELLCIREHSEGEGIVLKGSVLLFWWMYEHMSSVPEMKKWFLDCCHYEHMVNVR